MVQMWYSQCFSTGRYFMKTCLLIVMIIVLDNCTQIRYYRECYMIEKQYKEQTLQSEKKKNFTYGWRLRMGTQKKVSDRFFWGIPETTCVQICPLKFPLYWPFCPLLGSLWAFIHFVSPSHINFHSFPWLSFILEAFTDLVCGSLFLLFPQSLFINIITFPILLTNLVDCLPIRPLQLLEEYQFP